MHKKYLGLFFLHLSVNLHGFIFHDHQETLTSIKKIILDKEKGAYFRTGDGDIALASGSNSGTHTVNQHIKKEMQEALKMNAKNILKSLPFDPHVYQKDTTTQDHHFTSAYIQSLLKKASKVWGSDLNVYSAQFLSHYSVVDIDRCLDFLKFLKKSNCSLLIGNEDIPLPIVNLLFGEHCIHLTTPQKNPYAAIDEIEQKTLEMLARLDKDSYHIVILCLGNTGRILVKRIYHTIGSNIFFFDFGSLIDAICGFESRKWIKNYFKREKFLKKLTAALND